MASKILSLLPIFLLLAAAFADAADLSGPATIVGPREIAKVLEQFSKFSTLRDLLIQTKLDAEIDSRQSVTLFAVADSAIAHLTKLPADVQKEVLSVHVVLDYYDLDKITNLPNSTALLTTLFQTSGKSAGKSGYLNATYMGDGIVKLGSAEAAEPTSEVVMQVAKQPYNISVIEITEVIMPPGIESASASSAEHKAEDTSAVPKAIQSEESTTASAPIQMSSIASSPENLAPGSEAHSSAGRLVLGLGSGVAILVAFFLL